MVRVSVCYIRMSVCCIRMFMYYSFCHFSRAYYLPCRLLLLERWTLSSHPLGLVTWVSLLYFLNYFYSITYTNSNHALHVFVYACLKLNSGGCPTAGGGPRRAFHMSCRQSGGHGRGRLPGCGGHGGWGPVRPRHRLLGGGGIFPPHLGKILHHGVSSWQVYTLPTEVKLT